MIGLASLRPLKRGRERYFLIDSDEVCKDVGMGWDDGRVDGQFGVRWEDVASLAWS